MGESDPLPADVAADSQVADVILVYDKDCPVCREYCRVVRIQESVGRLQVLNARDDSLIMREITDAGLDIDEGMVLKLGNQLYHGTDAIHTLAMISSRSGLFNRINFWVFNSRRLSAVLYPVLRFGRGILLKLMRKTRINNLDIPGNDRF